MPYAFSLPTTSQVQLQVFLSSPSHPSLPLTASSHRSILRSALKAHKRLPAAARSAHLPEVQAALDHYLPYLLALDAGLSARPLAPGGDLLDVHLERDVAGLEWRPVIAPAPTARSATPRARLPSFEYEVCFTVLTAALTQYLLARERLRALVLPDQSSTTPSLPSPEQRATSASAALKALVTAQSQFSWLADRAAECSSNTHSLPADVQPGPLRGLASLCSAEATLAAVAKDDPWPGIVARARSRDDTEWMVKPPDVPRVRVALFARLCVAAADHAGRAHGMFSAAKSDRCPVDDALVKYADDVRRTARARAARLLGIEADADGRSGDAIAWLHGAKAELGISSADNDDGFSATGPSLGRIRGAWRERREDRRVAAGTEWGLDGGKLEERRVIAMLEAKWVRLNDAVGVQRVPPFEGLLAGMPSGREGVPQKQWEGVVLDAAELGRMRAPVERTGEGGGAGQGQGDVSSDDDEDGVGQGGVDAPGAWTGGSTYY